MSVNFWIQYFLAGWCVILARSATCIDFYFVVGESPIFLVLYLTVRYWCGWVNFLSVLFHWDSTSQECFRPMVACCRNLQLPLGAPKQAQCVVGILFLLLWLPPPERPVGYVILNHGGHRFGVRIPLWHQLHLCVGMRDSWPGEKRQRAEHSSFQWETSDKAERHFGLLHILINEKWKKTKTTTLLF